MLRFPRPSILLYTRIISHITKLNSRKHLVIISYYMATTLIFSPSVCRAGEQKKWVRCLGGICYEFSIYEMLRHGDSQVDFKTRTLFYIGNTDQIDSKKPPYISEWQTDNCLDSILNGKLVSTIDVNARESGNSSLLRHLCSQ